MKKSLLIIIGIFFIVLGCRKPKQHRRPLSSELKALFGYNIGTYWIYQDSISGKVDSFYVYYSEFRTDINPGGTGEDADRMDISVKKHTVDPNDSEKWYISLVDSSFSIGFANSSDYVQDYLHLWLFSYPFKVRPAGGYNYDSGYVTNVYSSYELNGIKFNNTIISYHKHMQISHLYKYSDYFFISENAGIIKVIFDHQENSVYRVLKLIKYKIVI